MPKQYKTNVGDRGSREIHQITSFGVDRFEPRTECFHLSVGLCRGKLRGRLGEIPLVATWQVVQFGACTYNVGIYRDSQKDVHMNDIPTKGLTVYWGWNGDGARRASIDVAESVRERLQTVWSEVVFVVQHIVVS